MSALLYCATPLALSLDVWSNLVIFAFGIAALELVRRRAPQARDLWLLAVLILAVALASFYWHVFGTPLGFVLDFASAAVFMLVFAYLWIRRFYPRAQAILFFSIFFLLEVVSGLIAFYVAPTLGGFLFVPLAPVILCFATWLIYRSAARSRRAAWLGFSAILITLVGLVFRSIDLIACSSFPLGTHFLWHICVSVGAFLAVLTLLELDRTEN